MGEVSRRATLALLMGGFASRGWAQTAPMAPLVGAPTGRRLAFAIWRNGQKIGLHTVSFQGDPANFTVDSDAAMVVRLGPIPIFHYHHQASERWRDGRFVSFHSQTVSNGRSEQVAAARTADGVAITTATGRVLASADTLPLTHWNQKALSGPLFNPQTGTLLKETLSRQAGQTVQLENGQAVEATCYSLSGAAQISDWYDEKGVWTALKAKAMDGSSVDYRRSV